MQYLKLLNTNRKLLFAAILMTLFGGFGKTFLLSLYSHAIIEEFSLSNSSFAFIFSASTLCGGFLILYLGRMIDKTKIKHYAIWVITGLILSCALLSVSYHPLLLFVALAGMRLTGQGLMAHTSLTLVTRAFKRCRGKAISVALLGQPLGEALLPLALGLLISLYGWRNALLLSADFMAIVLLPLIYFILRKKLHASEKDFDKPKILTKKSVLKSKWNLKKLIKDVKFYTIIPTFFLMSFINTTLMVFLVPLAVQKGCTPQVIAFSFTGLALGNVLASMISGYVLDKVKASFLLPFTLIPSAICITLFMLVHEPWILFFCLLFNGLSLGICVTLETAIIAQTYGLRSLGKLKTIFTFVNIVSTALGPLITGLLLDGGISYTQIFGIFLILIAVVTVNSFGAQQKPKASLPYKGMFYFRKFRKKLQL